MGVTEGSSAQSSSRRRPRGEERHAHGGDVTRQCPTAGLLDEIDIDLVPILLGEGVPLFGVLADAPVELEPQRIVDAPGVTHVSYRVVK
jgi:dihydrofolate reductase